MDKTVNNLTSSTPTIDDLTISYDNADTSELKKTTWQLVRDLFASFFTAWAASSTDNAVARFDSTTWKIIQNSGVIIDDSNNISGVATLTTTGNIELGNTDTTLSRVSAGVVAVEGKNVALNGTSETFTTGTIELWAASDTTLSRSAAWVLAVEWVVIPSISSTNTLTNKRITKRVLSEASSATPSINTDSYDMYRASALAANVTSITVSGTPTDGQLLLLSFTDNGTPRTLTPWSSFENSTIAFPATTVTSTRLDILCIYNTATSKWRVIATA